MCSLLLKMAFCKGVGDSDSSGGGSCSAAGMLRSVFAEGKLIGGGDPMVTGRGVGSPGLRRAGTLSCFPAQGSGPRDTEHNSCPDASAGTPTCQPQAPGEPLQGQDRESGHPGRCPGSGAVPRLRAPARWTHRAAICSQPPPPMSQVAQQPSPWESCTLACFCRVKGQSLLVLDPLTLMFPSDKLPKGSGGWSMPAHPRHPAHLQGQPRAHSQGGGAWGPGADEGHPGPASTVFLVAPSSARPGGQHGGLYPGALLGCWGEG